MNRHAYRLAVIVVVAGVLGAMTLRGQTAGVVNATSGVALNGYDVLAYFTANRATPGQKAFSYRWNGVVWHFASAANRDAFARAPEKFAPQFGGFCAYGVSRGYAVDIDPEAFAVVDGKLYLNYSKRVQSTWNQDRLGYIAKAHNNWPTVLEGLEKK